MLVRTQIQLSDDQASVLKEIAAERGVSVAAVIRAAVDELVAGRDERKRWDRALAVVGRFHDREGARDVGVDHDRYLEEAQLDWHSS